MSKWNGKIGKPIVSIYSYQHILEIESFKLKSAMADYEKYFYP